MAISEVKGLARYVKVIDASVQDSDPSLSFTDKAGTRITEAAARGAVPAGQYTAAAQKKIEDEKQAIANEKAKLEAERDAALAELAALKAAAQKPAEPAMDTPPTNPVDDKKFQGKPGK